jgi:hypothetical protein
LHYTPINQEILALPAPKEYPLLEDPRKSYNDFLETLKQQNPLPDDFFKDKDGNQIPQSQEDIMK